MVLPVSKALQQEMESYGIRNKFSVVPNTVNTSRFSSIPNSKEPSQTTKILLVTSLTKIKGVYYLIQALSKVKDKRTDFIVDIIGDGPLRKEYEDLVKTSGLNRYIIFHGLKRHSEIDVFMKNCDFVVIPSLWENAPAPLIEALACGKPVVASNVGGIPEVLKPEMGILVPPGNAEALATAIDSMLSKYNSYDPKIQSRYADENFSYQAINNKLTSIYKEIIR
jgi:glycosyltransferase involved in cell wall biosynthesis